METLTLYKITKKFTGGALEGLTHTEYVKYSAQPWQVGTEVRNPLFGSSPYVILECEAA